VIPQNILNDGCQAPPWQLWQLPLLASSCEFAPAKIVDILDEKIWKNGNLMGFDRIWGYFMWHTHTDRSLRS